jgi:hypothetical protein
MRNEFEANMELARTPRRYHHRPARRTWLSVYGLPILSYLIFALIGVIAAWRM